MAEVVGTDGLIAQIYDAGLEPSRWRNVLDTLAVTFHAGWGMLWLQDFETNSIAQSDESSVFACSGFDDQTVSDYRAHHSSLNVWLPNASRLPEGAVTVSSALYPDQQLRKTPFYGDFLRRNDLFYGIGSCIAKSGSRDFKLSFVRSEQAGSFTDPERRRLKELMPHLRNAMVMHRKLRRLQGLADSAIAALELVPAGVILLTPAGKMRHANRRAEQLCSVTGALRLSADGALRAATPAATERLQRLIRQAVGTAAGAVAGPGGVLQLTGPGGLPMQVLVTPLPAALAAPGEPGPLAAIFCSAPDTGTGSLQQRLESLYGLTTAEARLTEALVNGQSIFEYAEQHGKSHATVRTQVRAACAKIGCKRQTDLVRLVLAGPAVFKSPPPA